MNKLFLLPLLVLAALIAVSTTESVHAWSFFPKSVCDKAPNSTACQEARAQGEDVNPVAELLGDVANIIALIAGAVAVIMIVIAGFQMVTSGGNSEQVTKARGKVVGAIIGLVIIALAWTIIRIVLDLLIE